MMLLALGVAARLRVPVVVEDEVAALLHHQARLAVLRRQGQALVEAGAEDEVAPLPAAQPPELLRQLMQQQAAAVHHYHHHRRHPAQRPHSPLRQRLGLACPCSSWRTATR